MTSKKVANIQISDILSFYNAQRLKNYSPSALRQELEDLRTLIAFADHELPKYFTVVLSTCRNAAKQPISCKR
jgi:hypothetical protein